MLHRLPRTAALLAGLALLAGCQSISNVGSSMASSMSAVTGWAPRFLGPYRPDVHQGNIVTQEMVDQLRQGMTREQVRFMLGTPLLTSEFHKDRWDYPYYLNPLRGPVQSRRKAGQPMHELSLCQGLLTQVTALATQHQASGDRNIVVRLGPLAGVEPQLLAQAYSLARAGTIAENAELTIETLTVRVACERCGAETDATPAKLILRHLRRLAYAARQRR